MSPQEMAEVREPWLQQEFVVLKKYRRGLTFHFKHSPSYSFALGLCKLQISISHPSGVFVSKEESLKFRDFYYRLV